jgi:radical SAM superfamily enzyme YgiQ (UPF0313 family)
MLEIMRGCTRGCRFCQAGFVTRPVRERPASQVIAAVDDLIAGTGHGEVALLSLSSSDYTDVLRLAQCIARKHGAAGIGISLPSLRIETTSADLLETVSAGRRGGVTFAPEAGTERVRAAINKTMPREKILTATEEVFRRGWRSVKLYFMIGLAQETMNDVSAIADLAWDVLRLGRKHHGRRARVHLGVSTFIPKPHTPFQWAALDRVEQITAKQALLMEKTGGKGLELKWNQPEETVVEALLSRGDRRLGAAVYRAWELGARFDGWHEHFEFGLWQQALRETGLDWGFYLYRPRPLDETLPWDHIDIGVRKDYLVQEHQRSLRGEPQTDCRHGCVACGILTSFNEERSSIPAGAWACP